MSEVVADALAAGREWLEKHGWIKGEFVEREYVGEYDEAGDIPDDSDEYQIRGYCAVGGLLYSQEIDENEVTTDPLILNAVGALAQTLGLTTHTTEECTNGSGVCNCTINLITSWNDHEDTSKQEVLDAFAKAEKITRAGFDPDAA